MYPARLALAIALLALSASAAPPHWGRPSHDTTAVVVEIDTATATATAIVTADPSPAAPAPSTTETPAATSGSGSSSGSGSTSSGDTFNLHVVNKCANAKTVGITGVTSDFKMLAKSEAVEIASGDEHIFTPNFYDPGLRLSGHMETGLDAQWVVQALLEFGYSKDVADGNVEGTAYDLSFMPGTPADDVDMKVEPIDNGSGSTKCPTKKCTPGDCPLDQGWTDPDQTKYGNPADTVCYYGKSDFRVTYCPS